MPLTLAIHPITEIRFAERFLLDGTVVFVDIDELRRLVVEDSAIASVDFQIARPGESCRAGPVFDIVEPRAKSPGGSPDWPGILGAPRQPATARLIVLEGAAVTVLREQSPGESRGATGYVLEMSGEAAAGSRYAKLQHLIVIIRTRDDLAMHARQKAYRLAQMKVAVRLARAAMDAAPEKTQVFDIAGVKIARAASRCLCRADIFAPEKTGA